MGKGKGKLECWFTNVRGGSILIEFKNLRPGRSKHFLTQMTHKLGIPTSFVFNTQRYFNLPLKISKTFLFKTY
jgi:ribosomal protein L16/L10AE